MESDGSRAHQSQIWLSEMRTKFGAEAVAEAGCRIPGTRSAVASNKERDIEAFGRLREFDAKGVVALPSRSGSRLGSFNQKSLDTQQRLQILCSQEQIHCAGPVARGKVSTTRSRVASEQKWRIETGRHQAG
jgi:hypothetical protein